MSSIIDAVRTVTNPEELLRLITPFFNSWIGYAVLFGIVFAETGLLVGFFLPGDSLLFLIGTIAGAGNLEIVPVNITLMAAAIIGDTFGYMLGRKTGPKIFSRPDSRLFRQEYVERTQRFYEKHGGKTIIYARFVPIVRTFAPFIAGVGRMDYRRFLMFNIFGGIGWVFAMTMLGYVLGGVPIIKQHLEKVILLIIFVSVLPVIAEGVKAYRNRKLQDVAGKP